jgi:hypothetical protein
VISEIAVREQILLRSIPSQLPARETGSAEGMGDGDRSSPRGAMLIPTRLGVSEPGRAAEDGDDGAAGLLVPVG